MTRAPAQCAETHSRQRRGELACRSARQRGRAGSVHRPRSDAVTASAPAGGADAARCPRRASAIVQATPARSSSPPAAFHATSYGSSSPASARAARGMQWGTASTCAQGCTGTDPGYRRTLRSPWRPRHSALVRTSLTLPAPTPRPRRSTANRRRWRGMRRYDAVSLKRLDRRSGPRRPAAPVTAPSAGELSALGLPPRRRAAGGTHDVRLLGTSARRRAPRSRPRSAARVVRELRAGCTSPTAYRSGGVAKSVLARMLCDAIVARGATAVMR